MQDMTRDGPFTGPETGDILSPADLEELDRLSLEHSSAAGTLVMPLPVYSGPVTGQQEVLVPDVLIIPTNRTFGAR